MGTNEEHLDTYLDSFLEEDETDSNNNNSNSAAEDRRKHWKTRVKCCGSLHSFYCSECCRILIPKSLWPESLQNGTFELPCSLHIVLDDRRKSSSGLQAVAISQASMSSSSCTPREQDDNSNVDTSPPIHVQGFKNSIQLFDIQSGESLPSYYSDSIEDDPEECESHEFGDDSKRKNDNDDNSLPNTTNVSCDKLTENHRHCDNIISQGQQEGLRICLLFPSPGESIPLSEVASKIDTLVVLDCKWTRTRMMSDPSLAKLQKVHLTNPPLESRFWRWHNAGQGMLSTIEAIYFATMEIAEEKEHHQQQQEEENNNNTLWTDTQTKELIHLMWLFGIQRAIISGAGTKSKSSERKYLPFTAAGKEEQRAFRRRAEQKY